MAKNPLHTKLCDMLGIEFPIIAFTHCKDVVDAVVNAGGFAVLGEAMHTPDEIAADIKWIRNKVGDKPFGIDLVLPASVPPTGDLDELRQKIPQEQMDFWLDMKKRHDIPDPKGQIDLHQWGGLNKEIARRQLDVLLDEKVPVICSGLGNPEFILKDAHEKGIKVFGLVGKARQAKKEADAGVDAIIAQGYDAAGHTGPVGTLSIVPECVAVAGDTPIIAAGGITTGAHLAASLCLGAVGVWTGTLWLSSREGDNDMIIKDRLINSTADDTVYSDCISGFPMRVLDCTWTKEWRQDNAPKVLGAPYQMLLSSDYIQAANDHRREDLMTEAAGQGVRFIESMKPSRQIVLDMVEEALGVFENLTGMEAF